MAFTPVYKNLVFEGGGVNGVGYCGSLRAFEEAYNGTFLKNIKNVAGSSVGSIVSCALAAGASVDYLTDKMTKLDFESLMDDNWGICQDMYRVVTEYGFYKGDALHDFIGVTMQELTGDANITFQRLYDVKGKNLVVTGTNVNRQETVYFSKNTRPNMRVSDAVRISSSFPLFFRSILLDDCYWVDGGLLNNYPIGVFDTKRYCADGFNRETLGFKIVSTPDEDKYEDPDEYEDENDAPPVAKINNLKDFSLAMGNAVYDGCQRVHIKPNDWQRSVLVDVGNSSSLNFKLTTDEKKALVAAGYRGAQEYLAAHPVKSSPIPIPAPSHRL